MTSLQTHIELLENLEPVFDEPMLYRYLGYPAGETADSRVEDVLARERAALCELLEPRGVWGRFPGRVCFAAGFPLADREVVLCVVTIGPQLEERAASYAAQGDVLAAFVLDTLGSVCAEGTAEAAHSRIAEHAEAAGMAVACRISPGYGTWSLEYQRIICDLLQVQTIGVRLTPGLMMVPRKSVSFATEWSADPLPVREGEQCASCTLEHCRYRRETAK